MSQSSIVSGLGLNVDLWWMAYFSLCRLPHGLSSILVIILTQALWAQIKWITCYMLVGSTATEHFILNVDVRRRNIVIVRIKKKRGVDELETLKMIIE